MSKTFETVLQEMLETHKKKREDYGSSGDPYGNFRGSAAFGIEPWVGAIIRQTDKVARLASFVQKGKLANESVADSLLDNAVYAVIAYCLWLEATEANSQPGIKPPQESPRVQIS